MEQRSSELALEEAPKPAGRSYEKAVLRLLIAGGIGLALYLILGLFDTTTGLTPNHVSAYNACFLVSGICGLLAAALILRARNGISTVKRIWAAFCFMLIGMVLGFMLSYRTTDILAGWIDFPTSRTVTRSALIQISRAYRTHGRRSSWNIQTMPYWSNLDIRESDYTFMLAHRSPTDTGHDPDEIGSRGYFCAKVTLQQAGDNLRILHAGSQTLPAGTVGVCPE
jgi:hypothetical protein